MDSNNSGKRGRPKTGRAKDGVIFLRVPEVMRGPLKEKLKGKLSSEEVDLLCEGTPPEEAKRIIDGWFRDFKEAGSPALSPMGRLDAQTLRAAVGVASDSQGQITALLNDIDGLEKEKVDLLDRYDRLVAGDTSEVVAELRFEIKELKDKIKTYEQERYG